MEQGLLATISGTLVGFVLGLIGGGGSVLAVPLLVYFVGVQSPHVAIGTSSVAVGLSAVANLFDHARHGNVRWRCAIVFGTAGVVGAAIGSEIGKGFDGQKLLLLFGIVMLIIAGVMFRKKDVGGDFAVRLTRQSAPKLLPNLLGYGLVVGMLSGFFGIGGGFLIVPALMAATNMPMVFAVGTSLFCVAVFGFTTAANYSFSGLVDWQLFAFFIGGALVGGLVGRAACTVAAKEKRFLAQVFAVVVACTGAYVVYRGILVLSS